MDLVLEKQRGKRKRKRAVLPTASQSENRFSHFCCKVNEWACAQALHLFRSLLRNSALLKDLLIKPNLLGVFFIRSAVCIPSPFLAIVWIMQNLNLNQVYETFCLALKRGGNLEAFMQIWCVHSLHLFSRLTSPVPLDDNSLNISSGSHGKCLVCWHANLLSIHPGRKGLRLAFHCSPHPVFII